MIRPLIIVACSAKKNPLLSSRPLPARLAYAGQAFLHARRYLEDNQPTLPWVILSARYGIIHPDDQIEYYDERLAPSSLPISAIFSVQMRTRRERRWLASFDRYICLGGADYCAVAEIALGKPVERPLAGMGIGQMNRCLKNADWDANDWATRPLES